MRKSFLTLATVALLAGCGSDKEPVAVKTGDSLDDAVNVATDVKPDPMAPTAGAPAPQASPGGAAAQQ